MADFGKVSYELAKQNTQQLSTILGSALLNMINPNTINTEKTIYSTNGILVNATNWSTSDFIPIDPLTSYHVNTISNSTAYWGCYAFYDSNKAFISYSGEGSLSVMISPANAYYMRLAVLNKTNSVYNLLLINLCNSAVALPANGTSYAYGTTTMSQSLPQTGDALNLLNPITITTGYGLNTTNGQLISSASYATSDFIPVEPSTKYHILRLNATTKYYGIYCFYNANKGFISSSVEGTWDELTTPSSASFVRYCISGSSSSSGVLVWSIVNTNFCKSSVKLPYFNSSKVYGYNQRFFTPSIIDRQADLGWKFKYITTFGDSLVAQGRWQTQVVNYFGMYHTNCGQGGSRVAGVSFVGSDSETKIPMWDDQRINAIPTHSDLIMIHGGTNDHDPIKFATITMGNLTSTSTDTFYGAYKTMLNKMIVRCPNARIVILLPFWNSGENSDAVLEDIRDAIRVIGASYGFPVIESRKLFGFNASNCSTYFLNESGTYVHINPVGGNRVADHVIGFLKTIAPYNNQTIALSAYTASLSVGGTITITTNGITVTWTTSNASTATVDTNGKITAVGVGTTSVTATDNLGNTAIVTVNVS